MQTIFLQIAYGHSLARVISKAHLMSEVVPDTHQEFWRPPMVSQAAVSSQASAITSASLESCAACHTEFMPGSRFCYLCGATRGAGVRATSVRLKSSLSFLRIFGFQHIKQAIGLPLPSLAGLFVGIGCLVAALAVGSILRPQSAAEFQVVQLLRIEWLLGSVAAFLAGILLRRDRPNI
ncbi:MAG: hypothetical protein ACHP8A_08070 [Terriglobales bacterium]|jgi:hypothetical protein